MNLLKKFLILIILVCAKQLVAQDIIGVHEWRPVGIADKDFISSPAISFDDDYIAFTIKDDDGFIHIYESKKQEKQWQTADEIKVISEKFGKANVISPAYNYDASRLYFSAFNGSNYDIYYIEREDGQWSAPVALPSSINSTADETDVSISADDNTLFFIRLDKDDKDCGRIYYSKRNKKGQWENASALPDPISTGCDRSPQLLIDNKTLIFASKRNKDKRFKIYYTQNLMGDFWKIPVPLAEFDEKNDMLYPCYDTQNALLFYASQRSSSKSSIFYGTYPKKYKPAKVITVNGKIKDKKQNPVKGEIILLNPISMEAEARYSNNLPDGKFTYYLPTTEKYIIDYTAPSHSHYFYNFDAEKISKDSLKTDVTLFDSVLLQLNVFDRDIYEPLDVDMDITDKSTGEKIKFNPQRIEKGKYLVKLPLGKNIDIHFSGFYLKDSIINFDFTGIVLFENFEKNIDLVSEKIPFKFKITDKQTGAGIETEFVLVDKKTKKKIVTKVKTDKDGNATVYLRKGGSYDILVSPQGYAFYSTQLDLSKEQKHEKDIELQPLKKDVTLELPNITFELNSAELKVESYKELDEVIELMNKNPQIKVEISAHTDDLGSEQYNLKLSERRAKSVVDYLLMHDIPSDRMIAKGYGESKPLVPNTSDENRAKNRRVELKIIDVNQ